MNSTRRRNGKPAFDLIEEAVHIVRTARPATLAMYYLGAVPFVLGLLFFWADMSRSPFAYQHLSGASLGMGLLFFWMKFWQSIFALNIRAQLAGEAPPRPGPGRCLKIFLSQAILQPFGLFLIPLSVFPVLPFVWVFAFFQNATAFGSADEGISKLFKKSCDQSSFWPLQNMIALLCVLGFGFYVLLNWFTFCLTLPGLIKMLFGIQSAFSNSPESLLNSTFLAAIFGLTYLCVDPVIKTLYAARCFYGESVQSGEDLKAELKPYLAQKAAAVLLIFGALFLALPVAAENPAPPAFSPGVNSIPPSDLDHAINQTISERKYVWRMPREKITDADRSEGIFTKFFEAMGRWIRECARKFLHWLADLLRKLFSHQNNPVHEEESGYGWIEAVDLLLYGLVAAVAATLAIMLYRLWRRRGRKPAIITAETIPAIPDITDENVVADQLPEDGWTKMARELLERGEFRLAMRAFYLASLSHLAAKNLINLARFKSNRDYGRELRRRAHAFPGLLAVFDDNVSAFERIWYGRHEVNPEIVSRFAANVEQIKSTA